MNEWRSRAACIRRDPETFFPLTEKKELSEKPLAVCRICPVSAECKQWAIDTWQEHGIWGGMTVRELREEVRKVKPKRLTPVQDRALEYLMKGNKRWTLSTFLKASPRRATEIIQELQAAGYSVPDIRKGDKDAGTGR